MSESSVSAACVRALIVEDNPGDARLVQEALKEIGPEGFCLTHVDSLAKAEQALTTDSFEVILLDLTLPDSRGIETFRRMARRTERPIVVLTGAEDGMLENQLMREGAFDYLPKRHLEGALLARILRNAAQTKR